MHQRPGKPIRNGFVVRINGKLRNERLSSRQIRPRPDRGIQVAATAPGDAGRIDR